MKNLRIVIYGKDIYSKRKKDAEYEYVFIPSYYAVKTLILYYINNQEQAERIYGLKNAVVRRNVKKFYGGLPFILKYIGGDFEDNRIDINKLKEDKCLQKKQEIKAKEKISKTPKYPKNDSPEDSELLKGDLKGWLSQRISKKDRLVYKIESDKKADKKIVYIAAVYGHYDKAPRRTKSTDSYR